MEVNDSDRSMTSRKRTGNID